ncbi:hypothetical protein B0T21DRAFT_406258 [Apiosordaria backusii]|uniref:Uncharacterized protein n=1 Tax=Apiosordaria backusii TaxID=314023 RepID=A0AA40EYE7_9PEZI|nr:hypothetical protein B0T21DRAFT_406258 [Apiosordaria backusii]
MKRLEMEKKRLEKERLEKERLEKEKLEKERERLNKKSEGPNKETGSLVKKSSPGVTSNYDPNKMWWEAVDSMVALNSTCPPQHGEERDEKLQNERQERFEKLRKEWEEMAEKNRKKSLEMERLKKKIKCRYSLLLHHRTSKGF